MREYLFDVRLPSGTPGSLSGGRFLTGRSPAQRMTGLGSTRVSLPAQIQPEFWISVLTKPGNCCDTAFLLGSDAGNAISPISLKTL